MFVYSAATVFISLTTVPLLIKLNLSNCYFRLPAGTAINRAMRLIILLFLWNYIYRENLVTLSSESCNSSKGPGSDTFVQLH